MADEMQRSESDTDEMDPFEGAPSTFFAGRVGTFALARRAHSKSPEALHRELVAALAQDARVASVHPGSPDHEWTTSETMYPFQTEQNDFALLSGSDHFHSIRFSDAITFEVSVPVKNQPKVHGEEAESDTYAVAWDGTTAIVLWATSAAPRSLPTATGQVVVEILDGVAISVGQELYVQACSPACRLLFAHRGFSVSCWADEAQEVRFGAPGDHVLELSVSSAGEVQRVAALIHDELRLPASEFALVKNTARRILDLERSARRISFELIQKDYARLREAQMGILRRVRHRVRDFSRAVRGRSAVREANLKISSLWLAAASIETLQQAFREASRDYRDSTSDPGVLAMFDYDLKSDESSVEYIDSQFAKGTIEYKTNRLSNRSLAWATVGGALLGASIASVAGLMT